jgi:hypothetical protein
MTQKEFTEIFLDGLGKGRNKTTARLNLLEKV